MDKQCPLCGYNNDHHRQCSASNITKRNSLESIVELPTVIHEESIDMGGFSIKIIQWANKLWSWSIVKSGNKTSMRVNSEKAFNDKSSAHSDATKYYNRLK